MSDPARSQLINYLPYSSADSLQSYTVTVEAQPDPGVIEDVCNYFLKSAFGQELSEINARSEAWAAVSHCWRDLSCIIEAEDAPASDAEPQSTGTSPASGTGGFGNGSNRKRSNPQAPLGSDGAGDDGLGPGGNGDAGDAGLPKKPRMDGLSQAEGQLSCPYRKRNPLRFNFRDHASCAIQPYSNMASLK